MGGNTLQHPVNSLSSVERIIQPPPHVVLTTWFARRPVRDPLHPWGRRHGEVYKVRDTKLNREVALTSCRKPSPVIRRRARFKREGSLKHQWLFLHSLDSVTTVRRLVTFYVDEHNRVLPHSAFRGQTPDEMYFGTGDAVPADLTSRAAAARRRRVEANRSASCETCPSVDAAA